jgi:hypothetical protein
MRLEAVARSSVRVTRSVRFQRARFLDAVIFLPLNREWGQKGSSLVPLLAKYRDKT